jgi:hypothetical protein
VVVFDKGDQAIAGLTEVARRAGWEIWPTLEVVLTEAPGSLRKRLDPETGLFIRRGTG